MAVSKCLPNRESNRVKAASKGRITVKIYPANQLGDYTQVFEELRRGTIDMAQITVPSQFDTRLEVVYLHYLALALLYSYWGWQFVYWSMVEGKSL